MEWIAKHATTAETCAALLCAPQYLSSMSEAEHALVVQRAEHLAFPPEDIADKEATERALAAAERGWRTAQAKVAERAGLSKSYDGTWSQPTTQRVVSTA